MIFWWMLIVWVAIAGVLVLFIRVRKRSGRQRKNSLATGHVVAHMERLTTLPAYNNAVRRYRVMLLIIVVSWGVALLSLVILSTRPISQQVVTPAQKNRDIMLCMDVSQSMFDVDKQVVDRFSQLVKQFNGQRVGMTIFNSHAVTLFPLTDDYDLVNSQLQSAAKIFSSGTSTYDESYYNFLEGTDSDDDTGSSLTGDGLASCLSHLGDNQAKRTQSIILATDNEQFGNGVISLPQAVIAAKDKNARVYAIDPGHKPMSESQFDDSEAVTAHAQLKNQVAQTGGEYFLLSDTSAMSTIIDKISQQEATYYIGTPQLSSNDAPALWAVVSLIGLLIGVILFERIRI